MEKQNFIMRNAKWFLIGLAFLLFVKNIQSCNRKSTIKKIEKQCQDTVNVLNSEIAKLNDTVKTYQYKLELSKSMTDFEKRRADVIQRTIKDIRTNTITTVKIEGTKQENK